jgi:hypothetical protein
VMVIRLRAHPLTSAIPSSDRPGVYLERLMGKKGGQPPRSLLAPLRGSGGGPLNDDGWVLV